MTTQSGEGPLTAGEKTLVVLEAAVDGARFSDVVARTGLAKATVHRVLTTLLDRGFVSVSPRGQYLPGPRFLTLAGLAFDEIDVSTLIEPLAARLAEQVQCTVHVGVRSGDEIVYLVRADSDKPYRMPSRVGGAIPMHSSGIGKVVLAALDDDAVRHLVARTGLVRRTARTHTDVRSLLDDLAEIRERGYAFDLEENNPGVICVSAAVTDYTQRPVYGVSVSTLALEHTTEQLAAMSAPLLETAAAMSAALGGPERHRQ